MDGETKQLLRVIARALTAMVHLKAAEKFPHEVVKAFMEDGTDTPVGATAMHLVECALHNLGVELFHMEEMEGKS